jgi:hypothetical protein
MRRASHFSHSSLPRTSPRAVLGADHPLVQVLDQITVVCERCLAVAALLAVGVLAAVDGLWFGLPLAVAAAVVLAALAVNAALLVSSSHERAGGDVGAGGSRPAARDRGRAVRRAHAVAGSVVPLRSRLGLDARASPHRQGRTPSASTTGHVPNGWATCASSACARPYCWPTGAPFCVEKITEGASPAPSGSPGRDVQWGALPILGRVTQDYVRDRVVPRPRRSNGCRRCVAAIDHQPTG